MFGIACASANELRDGGLAAVPEKRIEHDQMLMLVQVWIQYGEE